MGHNCIFFLSHKATINFRTQKHWFWQKFHDSLEMYGEKIITDFEKEKKDFKTLIIKQNLKNVFFIVFEKCITTF